ncbi:hypothetical protein ACEG17_01640 [Leptotrichia hongkongensis]|jgi:hypothetical protein|uniref:Uncharacterized protein n=1 Tax=Leptotrichia hongkongensis TaxID=554406 RepID=A0ABV4S3F4_9FUSO|nr:hypothetical protein [Leptotrichia hongkongensis]
MFEKFRLKNLSKVIQSAISNLSEQFTKKNYFDTFSKINFLNIENVALLYKRNKNIIISKSDNFLKSLDKYISNSGIDLSFFENVDLKKLVENFERLCSNGYKNFIENDIRNEIIERIKKILEILPKLYLFFYIILNYTSINENIKISRAPPYNFYK